jgi:hypothetical protein
MKLIVNLPDVTDHEGTELEFGKNAIMVVFPTRDFVSSDERIRWEKASAKAIVGLRDEMGWS